LVLYKAKWYQVKGYKANYLVPSIHGTMLNYLVPSKAFDSQSELILCDTEYTWYHMIV